MAISFYMKIHIKTIINRNNIETQNNTSKFTAKRCGIFLHKKQCYN